MLDPACEARPQSGEHLLDTGGGLEATLCPARDAVDTRHCVLAPACVGGKDIAEDLLQNLARCSAVSFAADFGGFLECPPVDAPPTEGECAVSTGERCD